MAKVHNCRLSAAAIRDLPEQIYPHPINPNAVRNTRSLGSALGLNLLGLHLVRLKPGRDSSEYHFHHGSDEFVYVLEGHGAARVGDEEFEIGPGDCLGFPALGPAHVLRNPTNDDLVYLCGGSRGGNDVCDYPEARKRLYVSGNETHFGPLTEDNQ